MAVLFGLSWLLVLVWWVFVGGMWCIFSLFAYIVLCLIFDVPFLDPLFDVFVFSYFHYFYVIYLAVYNRFGF